MLTNEYNRTNLLRKSESPPSSVIVPLCSPLSSLILASISVGRHLCLNAATKSRGGKDKNERQRDDVCTLFMRHSPRTLSLSPPVTLCSYSVGLMALHSFAVAVREPSVVMGSLTLVVPKLLLIYYHL